MPRREEATLRSPLPDLSDAFGDLLRRDVELDPVEAGALERSLRRVRGRSDGSGPGTSTDFSSAIG
jgi:FXSXX-COOH protein